jgi:hypothetical protein
LKKAPCGNVIVASAKQLSKMRARKLKARLDDSTANESGSATVQRMSNRPGHVSGTSVNERAAHGRANAASPSTSTGRGIRPTAMSPVRPRRRAINRLSMTAATASGANS